MKDEMPKLENVDMATVTIAAYSGKEGTFSYEEEYTYPENEIPSYAFYTYNVYGGGKPLKSVVLPSSIYSIASVAFRRCISLTSLTIPSSVIRIGNSAFSECSNLADIELPTSLKVIEEYAFESCTSFTSIIIPSSVDSINSFAFGNCSSLSSVTFPSSVMNIGDGAFNRCNSLKTIYANPCHPIDLSDDYDVFGSVDKTSCILFVPAGSRELYAAADQWKDFKNIVEMTTGIYDLKQNNIQFNYYPNPFSQHLTIEILNPKHMKLSVDIYNINGQRVKNLAYGNKAEGITLSWDGTNELGQQVLPGVYICRINGNTMQIVKGK